MAHYAKVLDGIVKEVIVADIEFFDTFVDDTPGEWIQTSYNSLGGKHPEGRSLRMNYADEGYTYDSVRDAFIPPKPFSSWTLNEDTCLWDSPMPMPEEGNYMWDEEIQDWVILDEQPVT